MTHLRLLAASAMLVGLATWAAWPDDPPTGAPRRRVQVYRNGSGAMHPTLRDGQLVSVLLFEDSVEALGQVRRGDVVVFKWPLDTSRKFVKRVVGVSGDTLAMRAGVLTVNGASVGEPYAVRNDSIPLEPSPEIEEVAGKLPRGRRPDRDNWGPVVVPSGSFFVLGDNRAQSLDSRYWGFVPASYILGPASRPRAASP